MFGPTPGGASASWISQPPRVPCWKSAPTCPSRRAQLARRLAALGFAVANKLAGTPGRGIAVIGDGAMSAGMAYEAMNNAGLQKRNMIVILNDNNMSIAPNKWAISNYFTDYQAKHGGMGFAYDLADLGQQLADHNLLMHHWHRLFPGEILEINYEDVVEDLEGSARKMLDYIGVAWEPQVLAFNELDRPVKTASVWQVRQPVYKTSKAKWERYQDRLAPLIKGTNTKIEWDPIEMTTLPEAGLLTGGVDLYKQDKLDEAEYSFKKLLHHIPNHAAANFMVGLIYVRKGHLKEGIEFMEKGFKLCPWNKNWRKDLIQAYEMIGDTDKAQALKRKKRAGAGTGNAQIPEDDADENAAPFDPAKTNIDYLFNE